MGVNHFHWKGEAMKGARQRALPLRKADYRKRFREERRPELVRMLAELLLQALKSDGCRQGGGVWKR
jgi:hypothetical protein